MILLSGWPGGNSDGCVSSKCFTTHAAKLVLFANLTPSSRKCIQHSHDKNNCFLVHYCYLALIAQRQSTSLVNWGSWVQFSLGAYLAEAIPRNGCYFWGVLGFRTLIKLFIVILLWMLSSEIRVIMTKWDNFPIMDGYRLLLSLDGSVQKKRKWGGSQMIARSMHVSWLMSR